MHSLLDTHAIRSQFPILQRQIHGKPLVYLDNAATTHKPQAVLDALMDYYTQHNANVHRGVHTLSDESTQLYEDSVQAVKDFFGSPQSELVVTRNTTEAMNIVVQGWAPHFVSAGDVVAVTMLEHHSTFVPWQQYCQQVGAELLVLPVTDTGELDLDAAQAALEAVQSRLKVVAVTRVSNALGTVVPVAKIAQWLQEWGVRKQVLLTVDAAQSAAHMNDSLESLQADALVFSAHKMYGPMGVGGLLLRRDRAEQLRPTQFGGGMIAGVSIEKTTFHPDFSQRFMAGTPNVAGLAALRAACNWITTTGREEIHAHEFDLVQYAFEQLQKLNDVRLLGPKPTHADQRVGSVTWMMEGVHAHDVAQILDRYGVAVRSGHHCTMPLHMHAEWVATTRASFAAYNTREEVNTLVEALESVKKVFTV